MKPPRRGGLTRFDTLGVRLAALLTLAILPLGLIAVLQTYRAIDEARERTSAALLGETLQAARPARSEIHRAVGAAGALAVAVQPLLDDPAACVALLRDFAAQEEGVQAVSFVNVDGLVTCSSEGVTEDWSDWPLLPQVMDEARIMVNAVERGRITGEPAIIVAAPVVSPEGEMRGYVTMPLDHATIATPLETLGASVRPLDLTTFNVEGQILTSTSGATELPRPILSTLEQGKTSHLAGAVFRGDYAGTPAAILAVTPIVDDIVFALAAWPPEAAVGAGGFWRWTVPTIVLPLAMWAASLGVAIFAVHRLVIRHVRRLRKRMRLFSRFRRVEEDPEDKTLPTELAEVTDSFVNMAHTIIRDEAEQENSLREKDALLREIYHRVRNNLQLIASINNMQIRASHAPEAKHVLRRLQDRIMALATIHGSLYDAGALSKVRVDTLVKDLAAQITAKTRHGDLGADVRIDVAPLMLHPDQAVPLSLLVVEAMTNAVKHLGRSDGGERFVSISLAEDDESTIRLTVENSVGTDSVVSFPDRTYDGLGIHLMEAFVTQLGGRKSIRQTERVYRLAVRFDAQHYGEEAAIA